MYVIEEEIIAKSVRLLEKIDMKDLSYIAMSMQLDLLLLTRDVPLYEGLRKQGHRKVMLFEDFLRTI